MILKKLLMEILKTIVNIAILNLKIFFYKNSVKNGKVLLFFFSRKNLTLISKNYLEYLFKNFDKKILIIYGHQLKNFDNKNYYFLKESFLLKYLINVDIFFTNYISDKFTYNSLKIYMHHDISTAPLVDKKKEKNLFKRLVQYDLIFSPQKKSSIMFHKFLEKHNKKKSSKNIPTIYEVGYPKLDYLRKKKITKNLKKKIIVIAPTDYRHVQKLSIYNELENIIDQILKKTSYIIYFRPYPANLKSQRILKLIRKYSNSERFNLDDSDDYIDIYSKSRYLLTDISGTAITYSYFTKRQVIFYSRNEKLVKKTFYNDNSYFKDRNKFGVIKTKPKDIINFMNNRNQNKINKQINKDIFYLDKSKKRIRSLLKKYLIKS